MCLLSHPDFTMKSSYAAVLTDICYRLGRFDRRWGRFELGPFSIVAVLTGNPGTAIVVTRDFLDQIILSIFIAVDYAKKKDVLPTILSTFSLKFMGQ